MKLFAKKSEPAVQISNAPQNVVQDLSADEVDAVNGARWVYINNDIATMSEEYALWVD